jgi:hypothetical protein
MVRASRLFRITLLVPLLVGLWSPVANAQLWTQIGTLGPSGQSLQCVYFWNSQNGVAVDPFQGMWLYRNGIWTHNQNYTGLVPQSLRFIQGVLYAACYREAWKSLDSGRTWQPLQLPESLAWDCYLAGDGMVHGLVAPGTVGNLDQNIFGASTDDEYPPLYSTDGGVVWWPSTLTPKVSFGWSFYADTCRREFFTMGEEGGTYYSIDSGRSWFNASPSTGSTEDLMEGADGTMYHLLPNGFFRSVDAGFSWDFIGGPGTRKEDYHFQAFGPQGDTIIATIDNQVWRCAGAAHNAKSDIPLVLADTNIPCGARNIPIAITPYGRRLAVHLRVTSPLRNIDTTFIAQAGSTFYVWLHMDSSQSDEVIHIRMQASETCRDYDWSKDITIHRASPAPQIATVTKLSEKTCDVFDIPIAIAAADCGKVLLDTLDVDSVVDVVSSSFTPVDTITTAKPDTFHFTVFARHPGQQLVRVHIKGRLPEGNGIFDTILKLPITVTTVPQPLAKCARSMSVSNCVPSVVPIILQASPCDSVQYATCDLKIDAALQYQTSTAFPRTLAAGTIDTFKIVFAPQGLSKTSLVVAHLTGYDFQNHRLFDTTLQILVTFLTTGAELDPDAAAVAFDTISMCSARDTTLTFRNNGCDTITITQNTTLWQPGWSAEAQTLPIVLAPGESFDLKVHFAPTVAGASTQYISYSLDGSAHKGVSSQQARLSAFGVEGTAILSLSDTAYQLDTMSDCDANGSLPFTLSNSGCDSMLLTNAHLDGDPHFVVIGPTDTTLAPQSQAAYKIHFTADTDGRYYARFVVHTVGAHGERAHDSSITFNASVLRTARVATLSTKSIDFGALRYCDVRDTEITITNEGCKEIDISRFLLASKHFSTTVIPPITLEPHETFRIPIHCQADSTRSTSSAVLSFESNSDTALPPIKLASQTIAPEHFALLLSKPRSVAVGDDLMVSVLRTGTIPTTVRALHFDLEYDGDVLTYQRTLQNDVSLVRSDVLATGRTQSFFAYAPTVDRDTLATITFSATLAKNTTSTILLGCDSIETENAPSACYVRLDSVSNSSASVETGCGASYFSDILNDHSIKLERIEATQDGLRCRFFSNASTSVPVAITAFDLLGRELATQKSQVNPGESQQLIALPRTSPIIFIALDGPRLHLARRLSLLRENAP